VRFFCTLEPSLNRLKAVFNFKNLGLELFLELSKNANIMSINTGKSIGNPFKKGCNADSKKWMICFKYKNSEGKPKEWKKSFDLNQTPFVRNGSVVTTSTIVKKRTERADALVELIESELQTLEFDVDLGDFVKEKTSLSVKYWLKEWLKYKSKRVKAGTFELYISKVNVISEWLDEKQIYDIELKNFSHNHLKKFLDFIQGGEKMKDKTKTFNSLHNTYLNLWKDFYKFLIQHERLSVENQTFGIEKFEVEESEKYAKYDDVQKALNDLFSYNKYLGYMAQFIYYSLHRPETIVSLQWKDFDIENKIINIPAKKIKTKKKLTLRIHKRLMPILLAYLENNTPDKEDYFFGNNGKISLGNRPFTKNDIQLFGKNKTTRNTFTRMFTAFRNKKTTDKELFTENHQLYGFKHNGVHYYKQNRLTDEEIIKITAHSNTSIIAIYSREFEAVIDEDLFNRLD